MKTYRELIVWQKSMELVTKSYKIFTDFPKEEVFSLTSQLKRSIVSVPSNIAEGYGRDSKKEYVRFLYIAISSLFEYQTQIEIAYNLKFYTKEKFNNLFEDSREIEKMLSSLIRKLK